MAKLIFAREAVRTWHESSTEPFDHCRTIELLMRVGKVGHERDVRLFVDLSCIEGCRKPPPSFPALLFRAAVTVALAIVQFFKQVFKIPKRAGAARDVEAELAAAGVHGTGKELRQ